MMEENKGMSKLYVASFCGDVEGVKRQITAGASMTADIDTCGETPLHIAIKEGHRIVVDLLLEAGHSVNIYCSERYAPLHVAADIDDVVTVEGLLRRGADVNAGDGGDCTPLHYAAEKGCCKTTEVLLRHGANVNSVCHGLMTPLHFAVARGRVNMATLLLEAGAEVNCMNRTRQTPLHLAAVSGQVDIAKVLLKHGADVTLVDFVQRTPLLTASEFGNSDIMAFLLEVGSDLNAKTQEGLTALDNAIQSEDARCVEVLENHGAMLRAANFHVCLPHLGEKASEDFRSRCKAELEKMKATKAHGVNATLYDVLVSDVDRAVSLLRNDHLRDLTSQDMTKLFPIYASTIQRVVLKATNRLALLDDAIDALGGLTHRRLPTEILGEVTKYLHDKDLSSVIVAYEGLDLSDAKE